MHTKEVENIEQNTQCVAVSICLLSKDNKDFNLDEITNRIELKPTFARKWSEFPKGSIEANVAVTHWNLEIRENNCNDISIPLEKIYDLLSNKIDVIGTLCDDLNLEIDFTIVIHAKYDDLPLIQIPKQFISFIALINAEIGMDFYFYH